MTRFQRSIARFDDFSRPAQPALAPGIRRACRGGRAWWRRSRPTAGPRGPMTAPGTWSSPPRGAIAVPATASPSLSAALAFHRQVVAGFRARSIAPVRLRSMFRSAPPRRAAVAGSPAATARAPGAASSPATAAAAPGRPRGAERSCSPDERSEIRGGASRIDLSRIALAPSGLRNENGPPDHPTGRFHQFQSTRISAAPAPSRPGGLRNARPARPWRTRRRRP